MKRIKSVFMERVGAFVILGFVALYVAGAQAAVTDTTTITPGSVTTGDPWAGNAQQYDGLWTSAFNIGSASPSTTSNGKTYAAVVDAYQWLLDWTGQPYLAYGQSWISIGGFTSDPGASWLVAVGSTSMAGQAYQYQPAIGSAIWGLPSGVSFGFVQGVPLTLSITHN